MTRFTISQIFREALFADPQGENEGKNLVDGLFAIAASLHEVTKALHCLGNGNASTAMEAIEACQGTGSAPNNKPLCTDCLSTDRDQGGEIIHKRGCSTEVYYRASR
jgi:hypothetical protein